MRAKIRLLTESDLPAAGQILSLAFGTYLGTPDPENYWPDLDYASTRWQADPTAGFCAELDGEVVGSNFAARWGSVGFFGPLSLHPDLWDKGIGKQLMAPVMDCFKNWGVTHAGLYTFAASPKHIGLYQKFGFWPRFLTAIMSKSVQRPTGASAFKKFSEIPEKQQMECLNNCRILTDKLYPGLDLEREILAVHRQSLGETVLLRKEGKLAGFAVCHLGPGTEAGNNKCYVKFAAVRTGSGGGELFEQLLDGCEILASDQQMTLLEAGVNMGRHDAYKIMLQRGFSTVIQGVTMHRANEPGYNKPDAYIIDDWR